MNIIASPPNKCLAASGSALKTNLLSAAWRFCAHPVHNFCWIWPLIRFCCTPGPLLFAVAIFIQTLYLTRSSKSEPIRRHIMHSWRTTIPSMSKFKQSTPFCSYCNAILNNTLTIQHDWDRDEVEGQMVNLWQSKKLVQVILSLRFYLFNAFASTSYW